MRDAWGLQKVVATKVNSAASRACLCNLALLDEGGRGGTRIC